VVDEDEKLWTVAEAAQLLGPPALSVVQARQLVVIMQLRPVGIRQQDGPDRRGRCPRVYRAIDFIRAYDTVSRAA
jgi:hypothetical protein